MHDCCKAENISTEGLTCLMNQKRITEAHFKKAGTQHQQKTHNK